MILLIDNYDSFTFNLVDYFEQLGVAVRVVKNDILTKDLSFKDIQGVVISPGPETPERANRLNELIPLFYNKLPTLGICLGHQALAIHNGAKLEKAIKPKHGKISVIQTKESVIFKGLPKELEVVRYHSLVINDLPSSSRITALSQEEELMAFENLDHAVHGIQFHPEAVLTQYGLEMLRNWLTFYNIV